MTDDNGPTVGALNAESPNGSFSKLIERSVGHEIQVVLTDSHHILHAPLKTPSKLRSTFGNLPPNTFIIVIGGP